MSDQNITLSWMWRAGEGINALKIDADKRHLEWYDEVGCACGDSSDVQTFEDFRQRGAKFSGVPDDVLAELSTSLQALENTAHN